MRAIALLMVGVAALGACGETAVPTSASDPAPAALRRSALPARTDLGTLGGSSSFAFDIDDKEVVVGSAQTAGGDFHAFRWTADEGLVDLGTLPGDVSSTALAIAGDGAILGESHSADGSVHPVTWTRKGVISELDIPLLPSASGFGVSDINASGNVVGTAFYTAQDILTRGFHWHARSGIADIGARLDNTFESASSAVNDRGLVVGTQGGGARRAFLWEAASGPRYLPVPGTAPLRTDVLGVGLNKHGDVAGWAILVPLDEEPNAGLLPPFTDFGSHALVWTGRGGFRFLPSLPGGCCSVAVDLNDRRLAVGQTFASDAFRAVAWPAAGGMIDLNASDPNSSVATGVNRHGIVAGWTSLNPDAGLSHAVVWNVEVGVVIPAPSLAGRNVRRAPAPVTADGPLTCLADWRIAGNKARLAACAEGRLAPSGRR